MKETNNQCTLAPISLPKHSYEICTRNVFVWTISYNVQLSRLTNILRSTELQSLRLYCVYFSEFCEHNSSDARKQIFWALCRKISGTKCYVVNKMRRNYLDNMEWQEPPP
jgi:hypothetical protein